MGHELGQKCTAKVAELGGPIEELKLKEIGSTADVIDGSREVCRAGECTMGNLVADAMVEALKPLDLPADRLVSPVGAAGARALDEETP